MYKVLVKSETEGIKMSMYCYQCEQTAKGTGCTAHGVCGKDPETAALQDMAIHVAQGISQVAHRLRELGRRTPEADILVMETLFATVTNVDFDPKRLAELIQRAAEVREQLGNAYVAACQEAGKEPEPLAADAAIKPSLDMDELVRQGESATIRKRIDSLGNDVASLQELITYGLKGMAAYAHHARRLGKSDEAVSAFIEEALFATMTNVNFDLDSLLDMVLECGRMNLRVMEFNPPTDKAEMKQRRGDSRMYKRLNGMFTPMSKYYASEMCVRVANDAIQVLGGSGYMKDYPVERYLRDARITTIYEGTSQLQVVAAVRGVCSGAFEKRVEQFEQNECRNTCQPRTFSHLLPASVLLKCVNTWSSRTRNRAAKPGLARGCVRGLKGLLSADANRRRPIDGEPRRSADGSFSTVSLLPCLIRVFTC